ncbi:unnamed protein product [Lymnaea stagnalis]|uniref:EF-hand domain-containing protein n=1 Tax=Lymnaea stagnalis TaxID=6523 RepID=A0AAV2I625_LYMST
MLSFIGKSGNMSFLVAIFLCLPALTLCQVDEVHTLADDVFRRLDLDGDVHVEKQELVDYFKTYDRNGDGRVSQQEYVTVIDSIYASNPEWQRITHGLFNKLDYNNDIHLDVLDYDRIFSSADANANGLVAENEFNTFFHNLVNGRP